MQDVVIREGVGNGTAFLQIPFAASSACANSARCHGLAASSCKDDVTLLDGATDCSSLLKRSSRMPLLNLVVMLIVVGVVLYLVNRYIPMASSIKTILNIVVVCAVCVWVLQAVGLWGTITNFRLRG
jgi:predicted membrane protein